MSKIIFPPYEAGINYFKLVCDYENKYNSHEYDRYPPEIVWASSGKPIDDKFFHWLHCNNLYKYSKVRNLKDQIELFDNLNKKNTEDFLWAFITVGWNEQTVTPKLMLQASLKIQKLKYFNYCDFVLEKHRENGVHHHTHFLVKFNEKFPPSKIIGWIFTTDGVKKICREANFIDYLGPQKPKKHFEPYEVYFDYVRGRKKAAKLPYVESDRVWRGENKIEDLYSL